jgi:hypothetical protein
MKVSALLFTLAFAIVLVASVRMPNGDRHTTAVWGWVTLGVLSLTAVSVWTCVRMWATAARPKMLVGLTVAMFVVLLFAFIQWASWYK